VDLAPVLADLEAESSEVDNMVKDLPPAAWATSTPAAGWTIAHQIAHLAWTDVGSALAITDPDEFNRRMLSALAEDPLTYVDRGAEEYLLEPEVLLERWRAGRRTLAEVLARVPDGYRIPWYGTAMTSTSMATARIMETWAHGSDIAEALGVARVPTNRLRHIAFLGYRTFGHSFLAHGRPLPTAPVYLDLTAPDGTQWTYGPADADQRVSGPALDFCLLVTQRRHVDDLALTATGDLAREWLGIAQAFAGPPGSGRQSTVEAL
jgi:uncharacterized protein (TIGR03084 family)